MKKDDRVRLTHDAMRYKNRKKGGEERWRERQGTVISATDRCVRVLWDGRTSIEFQAPKSVEIVLDRGN